MSIPHRELEREYERRRDRAVKELEERKAQAYAQVPDLMLVDDAIAQEGHRFVRRLLHQRLDEHAPDVAEAAIPESLRILIGENAPIPRTPVELENRLNQLREMKQEMLRAAGLPQDTLLLQPTCPLCRDTGFVAADGILGHMPCTCGRELLRSQRLILSNLQQDTANHLDSFSLDWYADKADKTRYGTEVAPRVHMARVLEKCRAFADALDVPETRNLYLYGTAGTGKTFLVKALGLAVLGMDKDVVYLTAPQLFDALRMAKFLDREVPADTTPVEAIRESQLLIIDDLGTEPGSDAKSADLLALLDERVRPSRKPRRTVIASNLSPKRLYAMYDERIASRIAGGFDLISCVGDDIRLLKRNR